jgi:hypothetical protein
MTNTDAERVSDIVARLRPSFNTDLPVSHAIDKCREEDLRNTAAALSRWLVENNTLKSDAMAIIEAQSKALAEARKALIWAMDEIDVLSNKLRGFAYPQALPSFGREDQLDNYRKAVDARRAARLTPTPENPNG